MGPLVLLAFLLALPDDDDDGDDADNDDADDVSAIADSSRRQLTCFCSHSLLALPFYMIMHASVWVLKRSQNAQLHGCCYAVVLPMIT